MVASACSAGAKPRSQHGTAQRPPRSSRTASASPSGTAPSCHGWKPPARVTTLLTNSITGRLAGGCQSGCRQACVAMMYYSHNLHFIAMCSAMTGDYTESRKAAEMLAAHVGPGVKEMPMLEGFMTIPMAVNVRFHKWDAILAMKPPAAEMQATTGFWHFAHGMAF